MKAINLSIIFLMLVLSATGFPTSPGEQGGHSISKFLATLSARGFPTSPGVEPVYPISNEIKIVAPGSGFRPAPLKQNMTVKSYKYGHARVARACATATIGGSAHIQGSLIMTGVSSTSVQKRALKISEYLKTEHKEEFKREVTNVRFGGSAVWKWLGISASGKYSNEVIDKYQFGERSLKAAREEFTSSFDQTLKKQIEVQISFTAEGRTPFPTKVCSFIQVEEIKFTDSRIQHVATNDAGTMECVTPDGQAGDCKNKKLVIINVD
eukprot:GFUD01067779.1.p1 GENE.GFUD01067779.1~~GFUD01067779.1.p1  ORF type:complete len:267 (-),score=21.13 GFUD01067779.1:55-855(-)